MYSGIGGDYIQFDNGGFCYFIFCILGNVPVALRTSAIPHYQVIRTFPAGGVREADMSRWQRGVMNIVF